jgi:hydroxypyruvate isomerase
MNKEQGWLSRRKVLKSAIALGAGSAIAPLPAGAKEFYEWAAPALKGRIHHSVCRWTYNFLSLEELCATAIKIGLKAIDLIGPKEWPILKKHGLDSSMCNGAELNLTDGWNDTANHATLVQRYTEHINLVSQAGYKNLIWFTGNRRGMDDETGLKNTETGIKKILALAEKKKVVLQLELFNSKVDHKDYMADKTAWGVELCKRIGSENVKLLYDIYHMQINEGDVIRTIQENHPYFGHYHTAGVPGRHEIDESQELYYPAIMKAIAETGFSGYVAQEFIPTASDKIASLADAVRRCDV